MVLSVTLVLLVRLDLEATEGDLVPKVSVEHQDSWVPQDPLDQRDVVGKEEKLEALVQKDPLDSQENQEHQDQLVGREDLVFEVPKERKVSRVHRGIPGAPVDLEWMVLLVILVDLVPEVTMECLDDLVLVVNQGKRETLVREVSGVVLVSKGTKDQKEVVGSQDL